MYQLLTTPCEMLGFKDLNLAQFEGTNNTWTSWQVWTCTPIDNCNINQYSISIRAPS